MENKIEEEIDCPSCGSSAYQSNGHSKQGKPRRRCKNCGKYWTLGLERKKVAPEMWEMIWRMIEQEGVGIRATARITGVSLSYIQLRKKQRLEAVGETLLVEEVPLKKS